MAAPRQVKTRFAGCYKRGSTYEYSWRDASGKQRWGSARTLDEARSAKLDREREAKDGHAHIPTSEQITLAQFARRLFGADLDRAEDTEPELGDYPGAKGRAVREKTLADYRREMETWWLPEFGSTRLRAITHVMLTRHLAKIGKRRDPYLADATLHRILSPMSALLTRAAKEGVVDHNVCRDVEVPKRDHIERFDSDADDDEEREVTYTRAEMRALLAVLVGQPTLHLLVHLLSVTGLRISEALPLRWRDLVLDGPEPHVKVRRAWVRQRMGPPKSKYGRRNVPIPRALVDELRQQRRRLDPRQELVLPSDTGTGEAA
jgi:integrase